MRASVCPRHPPSSAILFEMSSVADCSSFLREGFTSGSYNHPCGPAWFLHRRPHAWRPRMSALPRRRADEHRAAVDSPPTGRPAASHGVARALGLGLITGAADDDPSAIGTYAAAGAQAGPGFLWTAPVTMPMMFAVVYLSAKLGQVTGKGLFAVIRDHYSRPLLYITLCGVVVGNTFEAAADLAGMAAAVRLLLPLPIPVIAGAVAAIIVALQIFGSYRLIRNVFRWLALVLLA